MEEVNPITIITKVFESAEERFGGSYVFEEGQTPDKERNSIEIRMTKDIPGGMGFIKTFLKQEFTKPVKKAPVLGIRVSTNSYTRDPEFNNIHEVHEFTFDEIKKDKGQALFEKIIYYDELLHGEEEAGAESASADAGALSESYYDSENRASDSGEHDKILGMIQTMDLEMWNQAFSFLEMGMALDWDEDAKLDLVWDIYEGISRYKMEHIRPIQRLINRYDDQDPFMPKAADIPTKKEVEDPGGYRDRVEILSKNWEDLKLAVADLLGIKPGTPLPQENQWKQAFKNKGII